MFRLPLLTLLASALLAPFRALGQGRDFLSKPEVELAIVGKPLVSRNLSSGLVSHWVFNPDGTVEAFRLGDAFRAAGSWQLHEDGRMCVSMMGRSGCRYWFRRGVDFANAETREPRARTVAEVSVRPD